MDRLLRVHTEMRAIKKSSVEPKIFGLWKMEEQTLD